MLLNPLIYFLFPLLLFVIGALGIISNSRDILLILLGMELMFLGEVLFILMFAQTFCLISGQIYAIFILCLTACESVVGLGILIASYREKNSINLINHYLLKG